MKYNVLEKIKLKTSKSSLELLPGQIAILPDKIAGRLLDEGKIAANETPLGQIPDDVLQDLFLATMNKINDVYVAGTSKYIQEHCKDLDYEISKADSRINAVWNECNDGKAGLDQFEAVLRSFELLNIKAVEVFNNRVIPPAIGKSCACGCSAQTYVFGDIGNGRSDWRFFCGKCNPHQESIEGTVQVKNHVHSTDYTNSSTAKKRCVRCGEQGERYCFGETTLGKYTWAYFCLMCEPYHFIREDTEPVETIITKNENRN